MEKIKMEAKMENFEKLIEFVLEKVNRITNNNKKVENQIRLAMEEVLANVINYAYSNNDGIVELRFENPKDRNIKIQVIDQGEKFDPLSKEDPDISLGIEERKIGGLGIFMVKNIMDKVTYTREKNKNILVLEKEI